MHERCITKMCKCLCMKFCASFPVAPQGRGNGTFLILLCFCIAQHSPRRSPSRAVRLKWKRHCEPVRTPVWQSRGSSWSPCRGRCQAQLFAAKERYRCGLPPAGTHRPAFCAPILFFLFIEKEKNRRGVRRSQLHSASAGAAKTPYPLAPSSFPKADRFAGSPFG